MKVPIEDVLNYRPDGLNESRLINLIRRGFDRNEDWHTAYDNPDKGAWNNVTMKKTGVEYRLTISKGGADGIIKRPDVAAQRLINDSRNVMLLFESKNDKNKLNISVLDKLEKFFEYNSNDKTAVGVRHKPFMQYYDEPNDIWMPISDSPENKFWLADEDIEYVFALGYIIGKEKQQDVQAKHQRWLDMFLEEYDGNRPLMVTAAGWDPDTYEPYIVSKYNDVFPPEIKEEINKILPESSYSTLNDY